MNSRSFFLLLFMCLVAKVGVAKAPKDVYIALPPQDLKLVDLATDSTFDFVEKIGSEQILRVSEESLGLLGHEIHETHHKCGGFFAYDTLEEALEDVQGQAQDSFSFVDYTISEQAAVTPLMDMVEEAKISTTIRKLSSYKNRYYKAQTGVDSMKWIRSHWEELSQGREDAKAELYQHASWAQPSVILTIEGSDLKDEVVVIGGHGDSIAGFFGGSHAHAPGADDNASGIATITEVIRLVVAGNIKPRRTLKFMAYAAEEVGLRGSNEIAKDFKRREINVVGALQLDMTNFKGSQEDILIISDFTNEQQNTFLGKLIDTYVKVNWGYTKCGYACSDHASWTRQGFAASFPFEAKFSDSNKAIHTANDTIERSGDSMHATNFAKLATAYALEMAKTL